MRKPKRLTREELEAKVKQLDQNYYLEMMGLNIAINGLSRYADRHSRRKEGGIMSYGILGHCGEIKPRFGLWLCNSQDCLNVVEGILAEGYDFDVCFKYGRRCANHGHLPHRPIVSASLYYWLMETRGDLLETTACEPWTLTSGEVVPGCYVREVFITERVNLRKRGEQC